MAESVRSALLIVDMINLFDFEGGQALSRSALRCAKTIAKLRSRFDDAGAPVIYVNDNFADWQGEFRDLLATCAVAGGAPAKIVGLLSPHPGHYHLLKPKHSAFQATALPVLLAKLKVTGIVLTGLAADSCILATAQDANMREFGLWVPRDAVAAQSPDRKVHSLAIMEKSLDACTRSSRTVAGIFPS
jgi:nicotinamidase-related amidase